MMATVGTLISIEEYLRTSYRPDCDFVDGQVEERNLGEFEHARLQGLLIAWFIGHEREWGVVTVPEQRIRVAPKRVRIADVCLLRHDAPREKVIVTPPFLCIEVRSPEDRLPRAAKVMQDYARMGVPHLWLIDPLDRVGYVYKKGRFWKVNGDRLKIESTDIHLDLPALFAN